MDTNKYHSKGKILKNYLMYFIKLILLATTNNNNNDDIKLKQLRITEKL